VRVLAAKDSREKVVFTHAVRTKGVIEDRPLDFPFVVCFFFFFFSPRALEKQVELVTKPGAVLVPLIFVILLFLDATKDEAEPEPEITNMCGSSYASSADCSSSAV
jgi:hypothetical protein